MLCVDVLDLQAKGKPFAIEGGLRTSVRGHERDFDVLAPSEAEVHRSIEGSGEPEQGSGVGAAQGAIDARQGGAERGGDESGANGARGDHYVTVQIDVPKVVDEKSKKLLVQFMQRTRQK